MRGEITMDNDGDAAFPGEDRNSFIFSSGWDKKYPDAFREIQILKKQNNGMSLRDWFAGMALQGICANSDFLANLGKTKGPADKSVAIACFEVANAMLNEREK